MAVPATKSGFLERRVPPAVVALLLAAAMWLVPEAGPPLDTRLDAPFVVRAAAGALLAVLGLALSAAGIRTFRRAGTSVNPITSDGAAALVTSGVYRYSRNPMYLGVVLALIGWACALARPAALLGPILFAAWMNTFQIPPEERALRERFGATFDEYASRVRRWL